MKKSVNIAIYYIGLLLGIWIMNDIIHTAPDYGRQMLESFESLDKLYSIGKMDLLLHLLFSRARQFGALYLLYSCLSPVVLVCGILIYVSVMQGMFFSFCTYYYGMKGILAGGLYFFPHILSIITVFLLCKCLCDNNGDKFFKSRKAKIFVLICANIGAIFAENAVNYWFGMSFFINR